MIYIYIFIHSYIHIYVHIYVYGVYICIQYYIGERGFFRIVRGGNYNPPKAYWAVPVIPDMAKSPLLTSEQQEELKQRVKEAPTWL